MSSALSVWNLLQTILYITPRANPSGGPSALSSAWQRKQSLEHPLDVQLRVWHERRRVGYDSTDEYFIEFV